MKKIFLFALAAALPFVACTKNDTPTEEAATVSISATAFDATTLKATVTVTLSKTVSEDVKVSLADAAIESGKTAVPVTYEKKVTVAKGQTSANVEVKADVTGLSDGEYQAAVKLSEVPSTVTIKSGSDVAYMNLSYSYLPTVNLYSGKDFTENYDGYVTLALDAATTKDVKVTLETATGGTAPLEYEKSITIKAGDKTVDVPVKLNPETLVTGNYSSTIGIVGVENGKEGTATSVNMGINFPLLPAIVIDGDLSDWETAITQDVENPAGSMYPRDLKVRVTASGTYLYFLYEVKGKKDYGSIMSDVFIDVDGDPTTGASFDERFTPGCAGIEILLEQCLTAVGGGYANGCGYGLWIHGGADGDPLYSSWKTNPEYNDSQIMLWWIDNKLQDDMWSFNTAKNPEDGIVRYEAWFNREFFGITGTKVRVGFKAFDWGDGTMGEGYAPQVSKEGDAAYTPCDMFTVHIPAFEKDE